MLKSWIPSVLSIGRAGWGQTVLLALSVTLCAWLLAWLFPDLPAWCWALLAGAWSALLSGWLRNPAAPGFQSPAATAATAALDQENLAGFKALDTELSASLDRVSRLSGDSVLSMISCVDDLRTQSTRLIQYLEQSGTQSDQMQVVIDKNAEIISFISSFIRQLEQKVSLEREHSKRLFEEVRQFTGMTDVIRKIARQTEILAINSTVEAVRAGEAGRSFAVLADEVRRLSLQSNETAANIEQGIQRLLHTVQERISEDFEQRQEEEHVESKHLIDMTQQLSEGYVDMRDFYKIMMRAVVENNFKLDGKIQLLLDDMGQYQDVFKQVIDRAQIAMDKRQVCLSDWLQNLRHPDPEQAAALAARIQALVRDYLDMEANHGGTGELDNKETGASLQRIELF